MELPRSSLHRTILARLLPAWVILSLVLGAAAYRMESLRAIGNATELASQEADRLDQARLRGLFEGGRAMDAGAVKALLQESRLKQLRLFDPDHRRLLEVKTEADPELDQALAGAPMAFPAPGSRKHSTLRLSGRYYVRVLVPLQDAAHGLHGYMEGIYLVPPRTVRVIEARIGATLAMVLMVTTLTSLLLYPIIVSLNRGSLELSRRLLEGVVELMRVLGSAIAKRDGDTDTHNYRVALYATRLAETMGCSATEIAALIAGAFLHDVGKIGISDNILLKPGPLTPEETELMHTHVAIGQAIIADSRWLSRAGEVVGAHHEWFDGSGYPKGLKGPAIPFNARVFAIVDVFDALTSRRPYKAAFPLEQAIGMMRMDSGRHFDPELLARFLPMAPAWYERLHAAGSEDLKAELAASIGIYFPT